MMNVVDNEYLSTLDSLLHFGNHRIGRNGGVSSFFGHQMRFDLVDGFPLLTTKKLNAHAIVTELLWFLRGDTNVEFLHEHNVHIWDEWADANGDLGPVYGKQWRSWDGGLDKYSRLGLPNRIDQIANVIKSLRNDPYSRRHIVTAWNPAEVDDMALPPCHCLFQFHVRSDAYERLTLDCHLYQRSADWFLGVPFNIASYALLTHLVARQVGMIAGSLIHSFGDYHLYDNHRGAAQQHLTQAQYPFRASDGEPPPSPRVVITESDRDLFNLKVEDVVFLDYNPLPAIKAPVSK